MDLNEIRVSGVASHVIQRVKVPSYDMVTAAPAETRLALVAEKQYNVRTALPEVTLETRVAETDVALVAPATDGDAERRILHITTAK